jgi:hypothetical protein
MAVPTLYDKGRVSLATGITAALNVGGAGKLVLQNAANTTLCTINLNNPAFGIPNATTGIAALSVSPSLVAIVSTSGTIAKCRFQNNAGEDIFGGVAGTFAFTASVTNVISCASHPFADNDVLFAESTGTLPAGLAPATPLYVINSVAGVSFEVSATLGGAAINITDTGTGSHICYFSTCALKVLAIVTSGDNVSISSFSLDPES